MADVSSQRTVLIADHDPSLRARLAAVARGLGLAVEEVSPGQDLCAALTASKFDLALLDVNEAIDGGRGLAALRGAGDQRQVLMILAELKAAALAPMMRLGVGGYVLRTQSDPDVANQLRKILRLPVETPAPAPRPRSVTDPKGPPLVPAQPAEAPKPAVADVVQPGRAVLVGFDEPSCQVMMARLRQARVDGIRATSPDAPFELVHKDDRVIAVIASLTAMAPGVIEQLKNLVYSRPSLTVVVCGGSRHHADLTEFTRLQTRRVLNEPVTPAELAMQTVDALSENHLDVETVQFLERSVAALLDDSPLGIQPAAPHFRVTSRLLAPIAAIIEIAGPELFGRMIISGDPLVLTRIARHWLGQVPRTRDAVWDAAGELTNRVAGQLRAFYRARGYVTHQSPPLVIEGTDTEVRQLARLPSIVFTFEVARPAGQIFLEWHLAAAPRPAPAPASPDDGAEIADSGELTFL